MRLILISVLTILSSLLVSTADSAPTTDPTPLFTAAEKGDSASIRQALNAGINVNSTDPDGWTPLMVAASGGNLDAVEMLLKAGAAINVASQKGQTPLMAAVLSGNVQVVKLLLDQGADASAVTTTGMTALDVAKRAGKKPLTDLLAKDKAPSVKRSIPATSTGTSNGAASKAKVDAAAQAFQSGDFSRATMLFKDVVKASPKDELAWYFLGQSLEKTGNYIDARKTYQTSLDLSPQGEYADQAHKKLAALPLPDARKIILPSGLTLLDWMNVTEKSSGSDDPVQILGEVAPYLKEYGPFPQLIAIRDKALNNALGSIKLNTPESAREALPRLAKLRSVAGDELSLLATSAKAQYLAGNFVAAITDYSLWLKLAPSESTQRTKMVNSLLQAKKHETMTEELLGIGLRELPIKIDEQLLNEIETSEAYKNWPKASIEKAQTEQKHNQTRHIKKLFSTTKTWSTSDEKRKNLTAVGRGITRISSDGIIRFPGAIATYKSDGYSALGGLVHLGTESNLTGQTSCNPEDCKTVAPSPPINIAKEYKNSYKIHGSLFPPNPSASMTIETMMTVDGKNYPTKSVYTLSKRLDAKSLHPSLVGDAYEVAVSSGGSDEGIIYTHDYYFVALGVFASVLGAPFKYNMGGPVFTKTTTLNYFFPVQGSTYNDMLESHVNEFPLFTITIGN